VGFEPLVLREADRILDQHLRLLQRVDPHPGSHSQEVVHREPREASRGASCRQRVVGSRAVITQDLRGALADEQAAIMAQVARERVGVAREHLEVLGREQVAHRRAFTQRVDEHSVAVADRCFRGLARGEVFELNGELPVDNLNERGARGDEDKKNI